MVDEGSVNDQFSVNVNLDTTPVLYTDNIIMTANSDGLVMDVAQKLGTTNTLRIVGRFGMSREHAKKFLKELNKLLTMTEGRRETGPKN